MNTEFISTAISMRHILHACPQISGQEIKTKESLVRFLKDHTSLEILPCGDGFYAAHREKDAKKPSIAIRADYDALWHDGKAVHLCGHDGHAASLCGTALAIEEQTFDRNIFLLFQPAEETGAGAGPCCELFQMEEIDAIYGCHNLPGFEFGTVFTRPGTFSCASRGITLSFIGAPTHAAYPQLGISPARAVGQLLCKLDTLAEPAQYDGLILCTVIGVDMGSEAFGAAAASAKVRLTLRGEKNTQLNKLREAVLEQCKKLAEAENLSFEYTEQDIFPAAENDAECAEKVLSLTNGSILETPMRWSEDFGADLLQNKGAFFGIGAGNDHPGLHTANYEYPDQLIAPTIEAFLKLIENA